MTEASTVFPTGIAECMNDSLCRREIQRQPSIAGSEGGEGVWEGRNGVRFKLNYPPCFPSSGSPSFSLSPFLARYQDNAEGGKGEAEGPPVGDEVYNICICLEMP